jgi:ribosomal protein L17
LNGKVIAFGAAAHGHKVNRTFDARRTIFRNSTINFLHIHVISHNKLKVKVSTSDIIVLTSNARLNSIRPRLSRNG